jgi:cardiolipin synthase A/B
MIDELSSLPVGNLLIAVLYAAMACAVTAHVLLRKRTVRAAVAWIGLAWLSPVIGAVLYYFFGVNRVTRRASRLFRGARTRVQTDGHIADPSGLPPNLAVCAGVVERLTGRPLCNGNAVTALHDGDEAYPAMLAAIRGARHSIALSSYIFRGDDSGRSFVSALAEARARGVQLRVLVDGIGGGYTFAPAVRWLKREGVPVARFLHHWLPWRMPYLNMRNHSKILVIDGATGFTGGMNIGDENLLARRPAYPVRDVHFRIEGPAVAHLMQAFAEDWHFTTGETLSDDIWWPAIPAAGPARVRGVSSGPDESVWHLEAVLLTAIGAARRTLRIVTPYFLPDEQFLSALELAVLRGVAVDIVIPERPDHRLIGWATRAHLRFLARGVRVHLSPPPFDHAKLMTVDGEWGFVGSANWDVRSLRLNFEFNLECYHTGTAAALDSLIEARIEGARPVPHASLAARPLPLRLRDAAARLLLPYL